MHLRRIVAATLMLAATKAYAFGGGIAVGMAHLNGQTELDVSFSATATLESREFSVQEQIYYRRGKLREEITMSGQDMVTIQRHDLGKLWMLMPQGFYMETPIDAPGKQMKSFRLIEHEAMGAETVNGMATTRYRTSWETDQGRFGGHSWVTDDGIVVKAELSSDIKGRPDGEPSGEPSGEPYTMRFEITELNRGDQPESLFDIPAGYTKMDLSGGRGLGGLLNRN